MWPARRDRREVRGVPQRAPGTVLLLLTPSTNACHFRRSGEDAAEEEPGGGGDGGDGGECGPAPIRPQATRPPADGDAGSKQALAAAAALEWQPSLSDKHRECSATSDEDHPRRAPCTSC